MKDVENPLSNCMSQETAMLLDISSICNDTLNDDYL